MDPYSGYPLPPVPDYPLATLGIVHMAYIYE